MRRMGRLLVAVGVVALLLVGSVASGVAGTGEPRVARVGGDFRLSGTGARSHDQSPQVVWYRTANEYLVVWQDNRGLSSTRGADI